MPEDVKDIRTAQSFFKSLVAGLFLHYFLIFEHGFDVYVLCNMYNVVNV